MITTDILIVIPARYKSTRFPGKPLVDLNGKSMIQRVFENAKSVTSATNVLVATDSDEVRREVQSFGGNVIMTSENHLSGTDRLVEVSKNVKSDLYVNLQGDEPLITSETIEELIEFSINNPKFQVSTLCHPVSYEEAIDTNNVKLVKTPDGNALYFSRSPIPYNIIKEADIDYLKHIGIYAYRPGAIKLFENLKPSKLEVAESLEQLRLLENGVAIGCKTVQFAGIGVDTPEDAQIVRDVLRMPTSDHGARV